LFEERELEKIPRLNKHHLGRFSWPEIHIPCEMCAKPTLLSYDIERGNRQFCSMKCHHLLKSAKKRHMEASHLLLCILKHRATYYPKKESWVGAKLIAEYIGRTSRKVNSQRVSSILKRWIASGLVDANNGEYRFNLKKLGKTPLAKAMYDWTMLSYAERIKLGVS
jgi:predicted nucleic acid-binding Zn ribbon protein